MSGRGAKRVALSALCVAALALFAALGAWQLERLAWKNELIERVEARIHARPEPPPPRRLWGSLLPVQIEYRRVRLDGVFAHKHETLVDALTSRGPGSWVLTPLLTADGVVLVNRGFVPPERRNPDIRTEGLVDGRVAIIGLMRATEPGGRILRSNAPEEDRWYSRDVAAIAQTRGLGRVAPFFVDADASPVPGGWPIGGLTVVAFRNAHLAYAVTWFALAALALVGLVRVLRSPHRAQ